MKRRLFTDTDVTPTEALLRKGLGPAMVYYSGVVSRTGGYRKQWTYSRGNGWILKIDDTRKSLCYVVPLEDGIEVSLTVRDVERVELMKDPSLESLEQQMASATKYSEGFALRFDVETGDQCAAVLRFLDRLMAIRGGPESPSEPRTARAGSAKTSRAKATPTAKS
jgi:hypothetical protein